MELPELITDKSLFLRSLTEVDATSQYLSWLTSPEINRYLEIRFSPPRTISDLVNFIKVANASTQTLLLGIFLTDGRHIGNIKLGPIDWNHASSDIGFLIGDSKEWGKGYASIAIGLMVNYAFKNLNLAKLTAGCYAINEGSRHALLNAGFVEEGRRSSQCLFGNTRVAGIMLGKVNPSLL